MVTWRSHRSLFSIALFAIPAEALAFYLLSYAPRVGVPRDPDPAWRLAGSLSAVFHAPALLLNEVACRHVHVPGYVICGDTILFGYGLSVLILRLAWWMIDGR